MALSIKAKKAQQIRWKNYIDDYRIYALNIKKQG